MCGCVLPREFVRTNERISAFDRSHFRSPKVLLNFKDAKVMGYCNCLFKSVEIYSLFLRKGIQTFQSQG